MATTVVREQSDIKRKLATIFVADVVGFSRLTAEDEHWTISTLDEFRGVVDEIIARHSGRIFNTGGDSVLAEFGSPVEAVRCAVDFQEAARSRNLLQPRGRQLRFRIGLNLGDVMVRGDDLLGDGVNVAARLEGLAEPGGICVSGTVWDQIYGKLSLGYVDMGEQTVKNIPRPVRAYRLRLDGTIEDMSPPLAAESTPDPGTTRARRFRILLAAAALPGALISVAAWQLWPAGVAAPFGSSRTTAVVAPRNGTSATANRPDEARPSEASKSAGSHFWLNGKWVVGLSKSPITDPSFCGEPDPLCRTFEVRMASGDGDYEVRWGFLRANSDPDGPAHFKVRGDHVSAVIPSSSSVEMERTPEGELVGGMVTPKGYTFVVRARKLQGQYPKP